MPTYRCKIATRDGRMTQQVVVADSIDQVRAKLSRDGVHLVSARKTGSRTGFLTLSPRIRVHPRSFYQFNQELAVLLRAGLPVVAAFDSILSKTFRKKEKGFSRILADIRGDIAAGESVSGAFEKYPHLFSVLYTASLRAGESGGDLPGAISRFLVYRRKSDELKQKVKAAAVYPSILIVCSVCVVIFLLLLVVPAITGAFVETGTAVPFLTRILLGISAFLKHHAPALLVLLGVGALVAKVLLKWDGPRRRIHQWILQMPVTGPLVTHYATARFCATLATLLKSGNPLSTATAIAAGLLQNRHLKAAVDAALKSLEQGGGFARSLDRTGVFPDMAISMIAAGEEGGSLDTVLMEVARFYDTDVENRLTLITSSIEPLLMVVMGGIIGFIVLAMYMPIFQMAGTIG